MYIYIIYTYIQWKGLCPSKTAFSYENPLENKRTALLEQSPGFSVFPTWKKCVSCYVTLGRLRKHCCFSIDSHIQVQQSWNKTKPTINGSFVGDIHQECHQELMPLRTGVWACHWAAVAEGQQVVGFALWAPGRDARRHHGLSCHPWRLDDDWG
jgi:hypothetical protein